MSGVGESAAEGMIAGLGSVILIFALIGAYRLVTKLKSLPEDLAKKTSTRKMVNAEAEERLYDSVRQEYESGEIRSGLWTKAEATANSTENAAIRAKYIQLRFEQLEAQSQHNQIVSEKSVATDSKQGQEKLTPQQIILTKSEDPLVNEVINEIEAGAIHTELWNKAKEKTGSPDQSTITNAYIDLRVTFKKKSLGIF
jgi:hypothetical protein